MSSAAVWIAGARDQLVEPHDPLLLLEAAMPDEPSADHRPVEQS